MKWKDWVAAVEQQCKEQGIEEDFDIFYIDTHLPQDADGVLVEQDEYMGVMITSF
jgi:hypothetical protein